MQVRVDLREIAAPHPPAFVHPRLASPRDRAAKPRPLFFSDGHDANREIVRKPFTEFGIALQSRYAITIFPQGHRQMVDLNEVQQQLAELKKQEAELRKREAELLKAQKADTIKQVRGLIVQYELTAKECGFTGAASAPAEAVAAFANPANPAETCAARGRKPSWYKALMAQGVDKETLRIKK